MTFFSLSFLASFHRKNESLSRFNVLSVFWKQIGIFNAFYASDDEENFGLDNLQ